MIPYCASAVLTVASPGKEDAIEVDAFVGTMRSRSGAKLKYAINDIRSLRQRMPTYGAYCDGELVGYELLDPSVEELFLAVQEVTQYLNGFECEKERKKALNIFYAGHGNPSDGAWELRGGKVTGQELHEKLCAGYVSSGIKLHVNLILDSCYSSRFLIDFIISAQSHELIYPYDCLVSSLPDETSWEMDFLEHGAMSYTLTNDGNSYVDSAELAKAIDNRDSRVIVKSLQGVTVPNPVSFLTNGRQHCVELISGHHLEVQGGGSIELAEHLGNLTHAGILNALYVAKTAYGKNVDYEP